jgi:hypothetical protein
MRKIGLLSDTHGYLDPNVFDHFADCDEVWHAGDIGNGNLVGQLAGFKPLRAVYGNIDGEPLKWELPETVRMTVEGLDIFMIHIAGAFGRYTPELRTWAAEKKPDILICGHSHICKIARDEKFGWIYLNPGACGRHGFHQIRTIARMTLDAGRIAGLEVIELGKRASL